MGAYCMDDNRQLRIYYLIFFSMVLLTIVSFTSSFEVIIVGLIAVPIISFTLPWLIDLISIVYTSLIYGLNYSNTSYENQFYEDEMAKANRLVREEKWYEAIFAYQEIINKAPERCEPRFNLAKVYQIVGQFWLAMREYKKIVYLTDGLEPNQVFTFESQRAIEELTKLLKINKQITLEA
jgi:tetratricopeptide (TPR) repeat protein